MVARINIAASAGAATFAISKPGVNVLTATAAGQFLFNSSLGATVYGQPFLSGTLTSISATADGPYNFQSTITHGLGFIPLVALFFSAVPLGVSYLGAMQPISVGVTASALVFVCSVSGAIMNGAYIGYAVMNTPGT